MSICGGALEGVGGSAARASGRSCTRYFSSTVRSAANSTPFQFQKLTPVKERRMRANFVHFSLTDPPSRSAMAHSPLDGVKPSEGRAGCRYS